MAVFTGRPARDWATSERSDAASRASGALALEVTDGVYLPISSLVPVLGTGWVGAALVGGIVGFAVWTPVEADLEKGESLGVAP